MPVFFIPVWNYHKLLFNGLFLKTAIQNQIRIFADYF
jgi:hypothetical protein